MDKLKGFIEVTALYDGRKACIRAECIEAVTDDAAETVDYGVKPAHRTIMYSGRYLDVTETYEEITSMIYVAEL